MTDSHDPAEHTGGANRTGPAGRTGGPEQFALARQTAAAEQTGGLNPATAEQTGGLNPASWVSGLLAAPMRPGTVKWIGLRPNQRQPLLPEHEAELDVTHGLVGDHYRSRTTFARQVTLIQAEHIAAIAGCLGLDHIDPGRLRRNIVVSGINLRALKGRRFRLGSAVCIFTGECHPCSRMEELGQGGYNAVRGHGGITARILENGRVRLGDAVTRLDTAG